MNIHRRPLVLLFMAALFAMGSGCSTPQHVEAPRSRLTVAQARKSMLESFGHLKFHHAVRDVKFTRSGVTFVANNEMDDEKPINVSVNFTELRDLTVDDLTSERALVEANGKWLFFFSSGRSALNFVDAALTLKAAALAPDTEEADFAAFAVDAGIWLVATSKPEMPDDARTYRALAKEAVDRKDFPAALEAYCDALERYPMWPQGQYNAAQLAAEAEDYRLAAHHMRRYVTLAPDADDAARAKDKYLLWQHKAEQGELAAAEQSKQPQRQEVPPGARPRF